MIVEDDEANTEHVRKHNRLEREKEHQISNKSPPPYLTSLSIGLHSSFCYVDEAKIIFQVSIKLTLIFSLDHGIFLLV